MVAQEVEVDQQFLELQGLEHWGKETTEETVILTALSKVVAAAVQGLQGGLLMVMVVMAYQILLLVRLYFMLVAVVVVQTQVQVLVEMVVEARADYLDHVLQRKALIDWAVVVAVVPVRIPLH
jgi:hypothetical protein